MIDYVNDCSKYPRSVAAAVAAIATFPQFSVATGNCPLMANGSFAIVNAHCGASGVRLRRDRHATGDVGWCSSTVKSAGGSRRTPWHVPPSWAAWRCPRTPNSRTSPQRWVYVPSPDRWGMDDCRMPLNMSGCTVELFRRSGRVAMIGAIIELRVSDIVRLWGRDPSDRVRLMDHLAQRFASLSKARAEAGLEVPERLVEAVEASQAVMLERNRWRHSGRGVDGDVRDRKADSVRPDRPHHEASRQATPLPSRRACAAMPQCG